jgi:hypothetical protein
MTRDYLIKRLELTNGAVLEMVTDLPETWEDRNQKKLVESVEYILLNAHSQIEEKIAEYSLKTALDSE